jgi:hypothetical protein
MHQKSITFPSVRLIRITRRCVTPLIPTTVSGLGEGGMIVLKLTSENILSQLGRNYWQLTPDLLDVYDDHLSVIVSYFWLVTRSPDEKTR